MKTKVLQALLLMFLIVACAPKAIITASTTDGNVEATKQASNELCQSMGYEKLAGFYPNVYYSPNKELSFTLCENYSNGKTFYPFIISHISNGPAEGVKPVIIAPDWITNFPSISFKPDFWNENTLIFRAFVLPCPESFMCLYKDGEALYAVNLESGEFSTLLSPQTTSPSFSYAFSISPDGRYLGYIDHGKPEAVYIRDLASGKENQIALKEKYLRVGAFVWTPDSNKLLFFGISYTDNLFYTSLLSFDRNNSSLSVLLDHRSGTYFPGKLTSNEAEYWYEQDVLYLGSNDNYPLYINIITKEVNQVPTTSP